MKGAAACLLCTRDKERLVVRRTRATSKTGPARIFRETFTQGWDLEAVARDHQQRSAGRFIRSTGAMTDAVRPQRLRPRRSGCCRSREKRIGATRERITPVPATLEKRVIEES